MIYVKLVSLILLYVWNIYWLIMAGIADKANPKSEKNIFKQIMANLSLFLVLLFFTFQFFIPIKLSISGISLLPIQLTGFIIVVLSFVLLISARTTIGNNWTSGFEAQAKTRHKLVTMGIYSYIRHPIYLGIAMFCIGLEMVYGSWYFISFFALFIPAFIRARKEDELMQNNFGKKYLDYKKRTKLLIPFVL